MDSKPLRPPPLGVELKSDVARWVSGIVETQTTCLWNQDVPKISPIPIELLAPPNEALFQAKTHLLAELTNRPTHPAWDERKRTRAELTTSRPPGFAFFPTEEEQRLIIATALELLRYPQITQAAFLVERPDLLCLLGGGESFARYYPGILTIPEPFLTKAAFARTSVAGALLQHSVSGYNSSRSVTPSFDFDLRETLHILAEAATDAWKTFYAIVNTFSDGKILVPNKAVALALSEMQGKELGHIISASGLVEYPNIIRTLQIATDLSSALASRHSHFPESPIPPSHILSTITALYTTLEYIGTNTKSVLFSGVCAMMLALDERFGDKDSTARLLEAIIGHTPQVITLAREYLDALERALPAHQRVIIGGDIATLESLVPKNMSMRYKTPSIPSPSR